MFFFTCAIGLFMVYIIWSLNLGEGSPEKASNVALKKNAMQSSTLLSHTAFRPQLAIDGNTQQEPVPEICTHTDDPEQPREWWTVDLGAIFYIYSIAIFGRSDCCADGRFEDFDVDVISPIRITDVLTFNTLDDGMITFQQYLESPDNYTEIDCPDGTLGQFVRLRHRRARFLTVCEVEVYGELLTCLKAVDVSSHHGFPGRRSEGEAIEIRSANSAVHCMTICKIVDCCYAANFNLKKTECEMRKKEPADNRLETDKDWNVFFVY